MSAWIGRIDWRCWFLDNWDTTSDLSGLWLGFIGLLFEKSYIFGKWTVDRQPHSDFFCFFVFFNGINNAV